jgi:hypothetical protein
MKANQLLQAAIHALAAGAPIESFMEDDSAVEQMTPGVLRLPIEGVLPSFDGAITWLNVENVCRDGHEGRVSDERRFLTR